MQTLPTHQGQDSLGRYPLGLRQLRNGLCRLNRFGQDIQIKKHKFFVELPIFVKAASVKKQGWDRRTRVLSQMAQQLHSCCSSYAIHCTHKRLKKYSFLIVQLATDYPGPYCFFTVVHNSRWIIKYIFIYYFFFFHYKKKQNRQVVSILFYSITYYGLLPCPRE